MESTKNNVCLFLLWVARSTSRSLFPIDRATANWLDCWIAVKKRELVKRHRYKVTQLKIWTLEILIQLRRSLHHFLAFQRAPTVFLERSILRLPSIHSLGEIPDWKASVYNRIRAREVSLHRTQRNKNEIASHSTLSIQTIRYFEISRPGNNSGGNLQLTLRRNRTTQAPCITGRPRQVAQLAWSLNLAEWALIMSKLLLLVMRTWSARNRVCCR